ncbi:6-phospho 3-hexuloisomerase, partial [Escherichia coli]|nr:6-phospho 3-hexuloisomerase [Escherichia coli]
RKKSRRVGGGWAHDTKIRHATITEFVTVNGPNNGHSKNEKDSVFLSAQPMASLYEQALLVIADALVMKMAAESGAPESELFKLHANLE